MILQKKVLSKDLGDEHRCDSDKYLQVTEKPSPSVYGAGEATTGVMQPIRAQSPGRIVMPFLLGVHTLTKRHQVATISGSTALELFGNDVLADAWNAITRTRPGPCDSQRWDQRPDVNLRKRELAMYSVGGDLFTQIVPAVPRRQYYFADVFLCILNGHVMIFL